MDLQIGMPVVLKDATGLEEYELKDNQKGMANALVNVDGEDYVCFLPDGAARMFYVSESRIEIDEERIEAWLAGNGE